MKIFSLPLKPLSINKAWKGRRFKSNAYKQFEKDSLLLLSQYKKKHTGWVWIDYQWHIKNFALSDEANFIKIFQDCLVKAGIIEDDRFIKGHSSEKFKDTQEHISFVIKEIDAGTGK